MKNSELEQRLKECNYRLSKMDERIKRLEEENEQLKQNKEVEAVKPEAVKPEHCRRRTGNCPVSCGQQSDLAWDHGYY